MLIQREEGGTHFSHTTLGSADSRFPLSHRRVLPTTPTTSKQDNNNNNNKSQQKSASYANFSKDETKNGTQVKKWGRGETEQNKTKPTMNGNNKTDQRVCVKSNHSGKVSSK